MENTDIKVEEKEDLCKEQIRCMIANVYDLQKMRISAGNRLVQSFYIQLNIRPSTSPNEAGKDEAKLIDKLKHDYRKITDAIASSQTEFKTVKSAIKSINKDNENKLDIIRDETDYKLVESYMLLMKSEEESIKVLESYVKSHPLWEAFFEPIKGCGTLMSAVCIAYLDIYKAKYPSSFFKYCGLDTVQDEDKYGNKLYLKKVNGVVQPVKVREKMIYITEDGEPYYENVRNTTDFDADGEQIFLGEHDEVLKRVYAKKNINGIDEQIYEEVDTGDEYIGEVVVSQHGRRKGDTEMAQYTDADGNIQLKRSITYNPVIKAKLMGVLADCMLKAGGKGENATEYRKIYDDYRTRLDNSLKHKNLTDSHKSMMAKHYMIKQFLRNLHTTWRKLEGLPIYEPYEVEKLGNKPHHLNEMQYREAQKWK